jgi:hypothetical protein
MTTLFTVKSTTLFDDFFANPIDRLSTIFGLPDLNIPPKRPSVQRLNVAIELSGGNLADAPAKVLFSVQSREPKSPPPPGTPRSSRSSMSSPLERWAVRQGQTLRYTLSIPVPDLATRMKAEDHLNEIATVVRSGGTSDAFVRPPLLAKGWALRGVGIQPGIAPPDDLDFMSTYIPSTGDLAKEQPDSLALIRAGGVEVLEVKVVPMDYLRSGPHGTTWAFVRSPADVFFYSGHGSAVDGSFYSDAGPDRAQPGHRVTPFWLAPGQLLPYWSKTQMHDVLRSPMDLDVLIINGCNVIGWEPANAGDTSPTKERVTVGLKWQQFLWTNDGPLVAILGYRDLTPWDKQGGNAVAQEIGEFLAKTPRENWDALPLEWLRINKKNPLTRTAAAIDSKGYYYINLEQVWDYHIGKNRAPRGGAFCTTDPITGRPVKKGDSIGPLVMS